MPKTKPIANLTVTVAGSACSGKTWVKLLIADALLKHGISSVVNEYEMRDDKIKERLDRLNSEKLSKIIPHLVVVNIDCRQLRCPIVGKPPKVVRPKEIGISITKNLPKPVHAGHIQDPDFGLNGGR